MAICRLALVVLLAHLALCADVRKYKIVTIHEPPFTWVEKDATGKVTSFRGIVPDLLEYIIKDELKHDYELMASDKYGYRDDARGEWVGLIGDVQTKRADIAAAALTKSANRERVVSFTAPFWKAKYQLLKSKKREHVTSIKHLANVTDVPYGAIKDGSTLTLLKSEAWHDTALTTVGKNVKAINSTADAVNEVRHDKLILILEGPFAKYWAAQPPCDLETTEDEMLEAHQVEYAFAVHSSESQLRTQLDAILAKNETIAKFAEIKQKYWVATCGAAAQQLVSFGVVIAAIFARMLLL